MDMSSRQWLSDLAMEDPDVIDQCQMMMITSELNSCFDSTDFIFDDSNYGSSAILTDDHQSVSYHHVVEPQNKTENISSWTSSPRSSGQLISFGSSNYDTNNSNDIATTNKVIPKEEPVYDGDRQLRLSTIKKYAQDEIGENYGNRHQKRNNKKQQCGSAYLCSKEHVLAERKRREKMTEMFLTLSALIPGLKKMDKASVLGEAAKYLKQLEDRVKLLEQETSTRTVESVVLVKNMQDLKLDDGSSSTDENFRDSMANDPLLEIEARASNRNILIRIHSQKDQRVVQKLLSKIDELHLTTLNCSTMPFGGFAMNIAIVAQMHDDFNLTMKDLVMHLRMALQQLLCLEK